MKPSRELDPAKIFDIFSRRKVLIAAVWLVVFSLSAYLAVSLPNVFESRTVILITPQKLPANYIHSTVTANLQQRIRTIIEQILSRSRLENIIAELNLFPPSNPEISMEERIDKLRKQVGTQIRRNDTIELSFEAENPEKARRVTARLASLFIDENLSVREQQAMGTTAFINAEAERLRKELEEQEAKVNYYKSEHRSELPEQLDANLRTIEQLRAELQSNVLRLSSVEEKKASLEQQVAESELRGGILDVPGVGGQAVPRGQLQTLKIQLEILRKQYSEKHPDVIRLTKDINFLEAEASKQESKPQGSGSTAMGPSRSPLQLMLLKQLENLKSEINTLRSANEGLKSQIASYQTRADNAPVRAIEVAKISRTYNITLRKYQDLLAKSLESQLAENMEKSQKSEQFEIIQQANFPERPVRPNRQRILVIGFLVGLAGGLGLAFLIDTLDTSFKTGDDLAGYVNVALLATIPAVATRGSILEKRRAQGMLVLVSMAALATGLILIHLFASSLPVL